MTKVWTTQNGDLNIPALQPDGSLEILPSDVEGLTATGEALLTAADAPAAAQVIAPGSTVLSAAATLAIAALTSESTAADIVAALQAS